MKLDQIIIGKQVVYIPNHAHGDKHHPDCERGVVYGVNNQFVYVRYGGRKSPEPTDPED